MAIEVSIQTIEKRHGKTFYMYATEIASLAD
jgi:hypothetical protein